MSANCGFSIGFARPYENIRSQLRLNCIVWLFLHYKKQQLNNLFLRCHHFVVLQFSLYCAIFWKFTMGYFNQKFCIWLFYHLVFSEWHFLNEQVLWILQRITLKPFFNYVTITKIFNCCCLEKLHNRTVTKSLFLDVAFFRPFVYAKRSVEVLKAWKWRSSA